MDKTPYIWLNEPEVKDDAYAFIFAECDTVKYLTEPRYGYLADISELMNTELAPLVHAFVKSYDGELYNMTGKVCEFKLTPEVIELLKRRGLTELRAGDMILQNCSLFCGDKKLYECCSHEGYEDYDESFQKELAEVCCNSIDRSAKYRAAAAVFAALPPPYANDDTALTKSLSRLSSINMYVMEEWQAWLRFVPDFKCTYKQYLRLARLFLSEELNAELQKSSNFKDLHPQGYARTMDELNAFQGVAGFDASALYAKIAAELRYLYYVAAKHGRKTDVDHGDSGPTIIINRK